MSRMLDRLEALGVLQPVDVALGRLLAGNSPRSGETIGVAAALASAALASGHSCLPLNAVREFIAAKVAEAGQFPDFPSVETLRAALIDSPLVARDEAAPAALVLDDHDRLYLRRYFCHERRIVRALRARLATPMRLEPRGSAATPVHRFDSSAGTDLEQQIAVLLASRSRFLVITGGPGTGKTTMVMRVIAAVIGQNRAEGVSAPRIALAAPTGKAAARLSEVLRADSNHINPTTRAEFPQAATTLHRLLGVRPGRVHPAHDREHPLPFDLVIVDEASMLDLALASKLCDALAPDACLILLGDRDQLAAVEAGSVFGALCAAVPAANRYSPALANWLESILDKKVENNLSATPMTDALVELRSSHRFGKHSAIGRLAAAVRDGDAAAAQAALDAAKQGVSGKVVTESNLAVAVTQTIAARYAALASISMPELALAEAERFRVLCALREGPFGARMLNAQVEQILRRHAGRSDVRGWYHGRLIIVSANDYRQGLFNGDLGVALATGTDDGLEVWFRSASGELRALPPALLTLHESAYALTVHKAQGSEFDDVLTVLPTRDARVLTRELLYTAITRARSNVELWASPEILAATIARTTQRWSGLTDALSGESAIPRSP